MEFSFTSSFLLRIRQPTMNVSLYIIQYLLFCRCEPFQFDPVTVGWSDDNRARRQALGSAQDVRLAVAVGKTEVEAFTVTSRRAADEWVGVIHGDQEKRVINRDFVFVNEHPQSTRLGCCELSIFDEC